MPKTASMPVGAARESAAAVAVVSVRAAMSSPGTASIPCISITVSVAPESTNLSTPTKLLMPIMTAPERTIHRMNWVRATSATPMILPNISSVELTDETSTSTTLEDFSSMTLFITIPLKSAMNI